MLVLSRKTGERIKIGDAVEIVFLGTKGGKAVVGITAPREVPIRREELAKVPPVDRSTVNQAAPAR